MAAVPLPSSIASSCDSKPSRRRSSDSGVRQSPQSSSSVCHALRPAAMWVGAHRSHAALLRWMYGSLGLSRRLEQLGVDRSPVLAGVELFYRGRLLPQPRHRTANARVCPARHMADAMQDLPAGRHRERFSERRLEPMTPPVTPTREGYGAPQRGEVLSPELALVDPELAAYARANLAEPRVALPKSGRSLWTQVDEDGSRALPALSGAALALDESVLAARSRRSLVARPRRRGCSDGPEPLALRCAGAGRQDASLCGDAADEGLQRRRRRAARLRRPCLGLCKSRGPRA